MVRFSDTVIESMGFKRLPDGAAIRARFHHAQVFAIEGIDVQTVESTTAIIKGRPCVIALGPDLNALSQLLLARDYVEDIAEWHREKSWSGPFLVTLLGPTDEFVMEGGHASTDDKGVITVFDGFPQARVALQELADELLPEILTAVSCQFRAPGKYLRIRPLETAMPGTTARGEAVLNFYLTVSGHLATLEPWSAEQAQSRLLAAGQMADRLPQKVAQHFKWAQYEIDDLKRFLYFFLALEIYTQLTFKRIDHAKQATDMVLAASASKKTAAELLSAHTKMIRDLRDRFIWCAMSLWQGLDDADLAEFARLKKVRDDIAHGHIGTPPAEAVIAIELLVVKVLLQ